MTKLNFTLNFLKDFSPSLRFTKVLLRNLTVYKKLWKSSMLWNLGDPIMQLLALGLGLGSYVAKIKGLRYIEFIAPGLVISAVMYTACFECIWGSYVRMVEQKTFAGILATPLLEEDIALGEIFWGATKSLISGLCIIFVTFIFGLVNNFLVLLILPFIFIEGLLFSAVSICVISIAKGWEYFSYFFTLFLTPMFFFSGIFFPLDKLPLWAKKVSYFVPITHFVEISRMFYSGKFNPNFFTGFLYITFITLGFLFLAINLLKWRLMSSK